MSKKKKGVLPSLEILIILVFFLSFIMWAMSKCNDKKMTFNGSTDASDQTEADNEQSILDSIALAPLRPKLLPQKEEPIIIDPNTTSTKTPNAVAGSRLYITIDGLNMRTGPHLDSSVVVKLPLFEEVIFMNEVTDSTQRISLGKVIADEPWVKVRTKRGKVGWVYGAGVHYHRKKREGVE